MSAYHLLLFGLGCAGGGLLLGIVLFISNERRVYREAQEWKRTMNRH